MRLPSSEDQLKLIEDAAHVLSELPNLVERYAERVLVVGDIHGSPLATRYLGGLFDEHSFDLVVFLGDYVDRGSAQIEAVDLVLTRLVEHPRETVVLRGNHELPHLNRIHGFFRAVVSTYSEEMWHRFNQCFALLPYCLVLNGEGMLVHGGISSGIVHLSDLRAYPKGMLEPPDAVQQLLWNDLYEFEGTFAPNVLRGGFWLYSRAALEQFLGVNSLAWLIRAHEVVSGGYEVRWDGLLTTLFSCPETTPDGRAAVLVLEEKKRKVLSFG